MSKTSDILGKDASYYLDFQSKTFDRKALHAPSRNHVNEIWTQSNRNGQTLRSMQQLLGTGRLKDTGYIGILPVDQGVEHAAGASFAPNPIFFSSAIGSCFCFKCLLMYAHISIQIIEGNNIFFWKSERHHGAKSCEC